MDHQSRKNAPGVSAARQRSAPAPFPDAIEPLDEETLDAIANVDRCIDPKLLAIIRTGLELAEQEERQEEERCRTPPHGTPGPGPLPRRSGQQ